MAFIIEMAILDKIYFVLARYLQGHSGTVLGKIM